MLSRRTLLLADDSPTVQKVVSLTFADEGVEVLTASGGEEALASLGERVPDVLLADVHMPAPNGYELCARVKSDARTSRVPVLLLVGAFEPFDEAEARRVGADGVLTKPFQSIRELVNKVGGLIGGHAEQPKDAAAERGAADARAEAAPPAAVPDPQAADVQPPPAFTGFDAEDDVIESVSAEDYLAAGRARAEDTAAEFVTADAPRALEAAGARAARDASGVAGEIDVAESGEFEGAEAAAGGFAASSLSAAAGAGAGHAASRFAAPPSVQPFAARGGRPGPDDSLLDLGDLSAPQSRAARDEGDLILDIGDDEDTSVAAVEAAETAGGVDVFEAAAEADAAAPPATTEFVNAAGEAELFGASDAATGFGGEKHAAVEASPAEVEVSPADAEVSPANLSSAWSDAPLLETAAPEASALLTPQRASSAEVAAPEPELETGERAGSSPEPESYEPTREAPVAADATTEEARGEVTASPEGAAQLPVGSSQLSAEVVDAIARRVVELMSDRAVREIAWEVVPDLAERLIRERLEREGAEVKRQ